LWNTFNREATETRPEFWRGVVAGGASTLVLVTGGIVWYGKQAPVVTLSRGAVTAVVLAALPAATQMAWPRLAGEEEPVLAHLDREAIAPVVRSIRVEVAGLDVALPASQRALVVRRLVVLADHLMVRAIRRKLAAGSLLTSAARRTLAESAADGLSGHHMVLTVAGVPFTITIRVEPGPPGRDAEGAR
jgi:hypothetical protein